MEIEKKFKTKTGYCHVLSDKIVLTRDGVIGNIAEITVGKGITRILLIYSGIVIFLIYKTYLYLKKKREYKCVFI